MSDGAELSIRQAAEALSVTASGPGVPLQGAGAAIASSRMSARVPVAGGEAEAPFELVSELSGIVLDYAVWAAIDPGEELPRDPGALSLHITGDGRMGADGQLAPLARRAPGVRVEMLGASVTGQGAVEFVVPPVPGETAGRPVGALAFTMTGVTALLDRLAALGTVPPGPLMGARMGLGFFTRPGSAPDTLETSVEFAQRWPGRGERPARRHAPRPLTLTLTVATPRGLGAREHSDPQDPPEAPGWRRVSSDSSPATQIRLLA